MKVVLDPRAPYTLDDRKANLELALRVGALLDRMSWAVDQIVAIRDGAQADAAQVDAQSPLHDQLLALAKSADDIRSKIVATKEGGAITGEERLREYTGDLYGDIAQYEGRPTDEQVARAEVLRHQLNDVVGEFNTLATKQLPDINSQLKQKNLKPIEVEPEARWQKAAGATASANAVLAARARDADRDQE
jgi:hypothetical protein